MIALTHQSHFNIVHTSCENIYELKNIFTIHQHMIQIESRNNEIPIFVIYKSFKVEKRVCLEMTPFEIFIQVPFDFSP